MTHDVKSNDETFEDAPCFFFQAEDGIRDRALARLCPARALARAVRRLHEEGLPLPPGLTSSRRAIRQRACAPWFPRRRACAPAPRCERRDRGAASEFSARRISPPTTAHRRSLPPAADA